MDQFLIQNVPLKIIGKQELGFDMLKDHTASAFIRFLVFCTTAFFRLLSCILTDGMRWAHVPVRSIEVFPHHQA
jgi:hypothetical protein